MNDEQVNEYMQALLSGKQQVKDFLERNALDNFRAKTTEIAHGQQRVQQLVAEAEQIRNAVQQLIGQRTAYSQLLVAAERARRGPPLAVDGNGKPLSLAEFRDRIGADKVEAMDNDGSVIDSSEPDSSEGEIASADETEAPVPEGN